MSTPRRLRATTTRVSFHIEHPEPPEDPDESRIAARAISEQLDTLYPDTASEQRDIAGWKVARLRLTRGCFAFQIDRDPGCTSPSSKVTATIAEEVSLACSEGLDYAYAVRRNTEKAAKREQDAREAKARAKAGMTAAYLGLRRKGGA